MIIKSPYEEFLALVAQDIASYEGWRDNQAKKAVEYLTAGDYSAAATACHHAYQQELKAEALRLLLGGVQ